MDLLSIIQALGRHKLAAIPIVVLVALASIYVVEVKPPMYEASSSILLTNPQPAATSSQIAANPKLGKANSYNTFASYNDLTVIARAVINLVTSVTAQSALSSSGVDPTYQVALDINPSTTTVPPIIDITTSGTSAQKAIQSANLVTTAAKADLYGLQKSERINTFYMIKAIDIVRPSRAQMSSSGKLRSLVAVLAAGLLLLLFVVSVADARDTRRNGTDARRKGAPLSNTDPREMVREATRVEYGASEWHDHV